MPEKEKEWCDRMANHAADALIDAQLIRKEDFREASAVISEELICRLALGDHPIDHSLPDKRER